MSRPEKEILERLGQDGLTRVLSDLLDQNRLVRLANTCGLKYPGMRTRSQSRDRILADLVQRAAQVVAARKAVFRALLKETRAESRKWSGLTPDEKTKRLGDDAFLLSNGQLGRCLFLLASSEADEDQAGLDGLLARQRKLGGTTETVAVAPKEAKPSREETRLKRRVGELQKKVLHLEAQLAKSRDTEKTSKRDLIQRKGELAESRMLAQRLRDELDAALEKARRAFALEKGPESTEKSLEQLAKSVRKLANEQKKIFHRIEKLSEQPLAPEEPAGGATDSIVEGMAGLHKELAAFRRERKRATEQQAKHFEELPGRLKLAVEKGRRRAASRATPAASATPRVGVFIDVQNMYYGARQLKGKLDFDALMKAAVLERRLIQATAYVVESSEIDQSGFIAILRKRAIDVRRKTLQVRADGSMKGDWDMELALDILDAAASLDVVVLVSGDGDFTSLVQRVKRMGPRVEVIGFPRTTAKSLLEAADHFQPLNRKFMIYSDNPQTRAVRKRAASKRKSTSGRNRAV